MKGPLLGSILVFGASLLLAVVPEDGGCSGPTAHWLLLEPLAEAAGIKDHFRAQGVFGPWIGLVLGLAVPGGVAIAWGFRRNRRARELDQPRGEALIVGATGFWLVLVALWSWWCWPG